MKTIRLTTPLLIIAGLLGACSTQPTSTRLLEQTRSDYLSMRNDPMVGHYATMEMKQADDALAQADIAARNREDSNTVDKLAYLAKQKIALTHEVAKQRSAESDVISSAKERDQIRLDQRTEEADRAIAAAYAARIETLAAERRTQISQKEAAEAARRSQEAEARTDVVAAQLAELQAKQTERGLLITLGDVLFGTDRAQMNPIGMRTVQKLAEVLHQHPLRTVQIEGFTDSTGSTAYNQVLSENRARSVQTALVNIGVARERVTARGYGEAYPVAANDTAQNRQLNRRVEILISNDDGQISTR